MSDSAEQKVSPPLETWAVVELMGHVKWAGKLSEESHCGAVMGRLDIPLDDGKWLTRFFGGGAVYGITPCDEATARAVAARSAPAPIQPYEMPKQVVYKGRGTCPHCEHNPCRCDESRDEEDVEDDDDVPF